MFLSYLISNSLLLKNAASGWKGHVEALFEEILRSAWGCDNIKEGGLIYEQMSLFQFLVQFLISTKIIKSTFQGIIS